MSDQVILNDAEAAASTVIEVLSRLVSMHGADESFDSKFRGECLSVEWFRSRREAKVVIEIWRQHYNEVRPHISLQYLTPVGIQTAAPQRPATRRLLGITVSEIPSRSTLSRRRFGDGDKNHRHPA